MALEFDRPGDAKDPANLEKFDQLIREVKDLRLTQKVSSLIDIVKDMNQVLNAGDAAYYRIPKSREMIAQLLLLYENAGGAETEKWVDYDYQRLRPMVEIDDYNSGEATRELRMIQERGKQLFPDAHVLLIGSVSQFTRLERRGRRIVIAGYPCVWTERRRPYQRFFLNDHNSMDESRL